MPHHLWRFGGALLGCGLIVLVLVEAPSSDAETTPSSPSTTYHWQLPAGFPQPSVPADNSMSDAKVALGRRLFYDPRLSISGDLSCGSCHRQELAFTDGRKQAVGATGEIHRRNTMSLANVAYGLSLTWADPDIDSLEEQLLTPLFGRHPIEMGLPPSPAALDVLRGDPQTTTLFRSAFPDDPDPLTVDNLARAIAAFERTLVSGNSPFDRFWYQGDEAALSPAQRRGMKLFFSHRLGCSECHGRFNFSGPLKHEGSRPRRPEMHNTGLYHLDDGAYPATDQGLFERTHRPRDMGKFKAPTLRNVALTAPYMHDGSIATLDEVLTHYAEGGRTLTEGPDAGRGKDNPWKSELLRGFEINEGQRRDLIAFLESLTDQDFLQDPRFSDPFQPTTETSGALVESSTNTPPP